MRKEIICCAVWKGVMMKLKTVSTFFAIVIENRKRNIMIFANINVFDFPIFGKSQ
jgi:hypothetical protein